MLHKIDIKKKELISLHEILTRFFNRSDAKLDRKSIKDLFDTVQDNGTEAAVMENSLVQTNIIFILARSKIDS